MNYDESFKETCLRLGMHIRKIRIENNLTLKEISVKSGIKMEYLKKIEEGKAYGLRLKAHLLKIAKALKVKLTELLDF